MTKTKAVELTKEDCINIAKWHTGAELMVKAKIRTPFSSSEHDTVVKISDALNALRY